MQHREFFNSKNIKTSSQEMHDLTEEAFNKLKTRQNKDEAQQKEFRETLSKINFDDLKQLFKEDLLKSGIDNFEFVDADRILDIASGESSTEGSYRVEPHAIVFDFKCLRDKAEKFGLPTELYMLYILSHEETHAASKTDCRGLTEVNTKEKGVLRLKHGYLEETVSALDEENYFNIDKFRGFDEGMTEKISREEIFAAYLKNHPEFAKKEDVSKLTEFVGKHDEVFYNAEIKMVNAVIKAISRSGGVDETVAWEALKQGKFSGDNFSEWGNRNQLDKILGYEVAQAIENLDADSSNKALAIANKINSSFVD